MFNPIRLLAVCGLALTLGAATAAPRKTANAAPPFACQKLVFESQGFTACLYDPGKHSLSLHLTNGDGRPLRHLPALERSLGEQAMAVQFAMNAGMFDEDGFPIGLYVEDGVSRHDINTADGAGNFYMKPNGVFWVDAQGKAHVDATPRYLTNKPSPRWATQSGPMLVIDGALHPSMAKPGTSRWPRNGVGVAADGSAWFVISDGFVTFNHFARFFRDQLGCTDALYLDGAISSLWDPQRGRIDMRRVLGPMLVVSAKQGTSAP